MAAYFHGSHDIPPEAMQTLYLMNPSFAGYSDTQPTVNMYLNPLVGVPVQDSGRVPSSLHWAPTTQHALSLSLPAPAEITSHTMLRDDDPRAFGSHSSTSSTTALVNSKYLRFAQQLLDEVVSLWKGGGERPAKGHVKSSDDDDGGRVDEEEVSVKQAAELTTVERQELQMKKAKLVNMLDEVGQKYRQYRRQMQLLVSSFEAAAGTGSARSYTALALQTISKQFRCLRDAIAGQIRATAKRLGEEEELAEEGLKPRGSRLRFIDKQVRQQRALQQLGMMHHNAWRPQRGLPERSVSVLRAWLFEHFLHPYPKDSDKLMLAKQTGLTRSQVSNWFINARVRLWKPMVEEMYKEEVKDQESGDAEDRISENGVNNDCRRQESSPARTDDPSSVSVHPSFTGVYNHASYVEGDGDNLFTQPVLKKACSEESMDGGQEQCNYPFVPGSTSNGVRPGEYCVGEIERFGIERFAPRLAGNSVSLTLGLTQYGGISLSGAQPSYIASNDYASIDCDQLNLNPSNAYEGMSIESRKRLAAQLLPDFLAQNM